MKPEYTISEQQKMEDEEVHQSILEATAIIDSERNTESIIDSERKPESTPLVKKNFNFSHLNTPDDKNIGNFSQILNSIQQVTNHQSNELSDIDEEELALYIKKLGRAIPLTMEAYARYLYLSTRKTNNGNYLPTLMSPNNTKLFNSHTIPLLKVSEETKTLSLKDIAIRTSLITGGADTLRDLLSPFVNLEVEHFKIWNTTGNNVFAFLIIIENLLNNTELPNYLWVRVIVKAITGTKILNHFILHNRLPSSTQGNNDMLGSLTIASEDLNNWAPEDFMKEIFRIFKDPDFMGNVTRYLASWNINTFSSVKESLLKYRTIISQISLFHRHSNRPTNHTENLNNFKTHIWDTLPEKFINNFQTSCVNDLKMLPLEAMTEKPFVELEASINKFLSYSATLAHHISNSKLNNNTLSPNGTGKDKSVNAISSSSSSPEIKCEYCKKANHLEENCFRKHPELKMKWVCYRCKQTGHTPQDCPRNHT